MLINLKYNLKFSSTGKSFSQSIDFKPGLTVITGANEQGKSLILEMIEYAWFGVSALRGQASDYATIEVDMVWQTKGDTHTVSRHGSTQSLNKTKAVGASAVNKAILGILGIDLDVFRIACSAKQGELDKLTARMRPTERRRMVDEVIGLNTLEAVEKLCKTEANSNSRLRDDLAKRLVKPDEPEKPLGYTPSLELDQLYKKAIGIEAQRVQLLRVAKPMLPEEPVRGEFEDDVTDYESIREKKDAERAGIERTLQSIPRATFTRQDIDYAETYYDQQARGPVSVFGRQQLEQWLNDWDSIKRLSQSVHCPECGTDFVPGEDHAVAHVQEPELSIVEIKANLRALDNWEDFDGVILEEPPKLKQSQIKTETLALAQAELRDELQKQLDLMPIMVSRKDELNRKIAWERGQADHKIRLDQYMDRLTEWSNAQEVLENLEPIDPDLENKLREAQIYEEQRRSYNAGILAYDEAQAEIDALNEQAEAYSNGAEALKFVRSQVKQHLVPSLNKVASHLLQEMTNGTRKTILVDEEFEVSVDGQPVRTLSGSGVSVVNLALRIALGQVLTQRVVPIFLGDELDADMDADRAASTHEAIRSLTKTLKQVIIVSHKKIEGDNYIGV